MSHARLSRLVALAVFVAVLGLFLVRARAGLTKLEFGDETEKYVAAILMRHGARLYRDIFANQGPLAYLIAWASTFVSGTQDFTRGRIPVVGLALAACAAIMASPALPARASARLWAGSLFLIPISALWFVHPLHMLLYHAIGGYLMTVVVAQFTLPMLVGASVRGWAAAVSGAAAVLAASASYPFAVPAALLLAAPFLVIPSRERTRHAAWLAVGGAGAALPVAVWISLRADWIGYFVFHLYFNQVVYGRMTGYAPWDAARALALSFDPSGRVHAVAMLAGLAGTIRLIFAHRPRRAAHLAALAVTLAGVLMLNPKGSPDFPDTPEMIVCFGIFALVAGAKLGAAGAPQLAAGLLAVAAYAGSAEWTARTALMSPVAMRRAEAPDFYLRPDPGDPVVAEIHEAVPPGATFLGLPFMPAFYITAQRLPSSGQFFYLPFQAEYDKHPILGRRFDLCGDIERARPMALVVAVQPIATWGSILDYAPCLDRILRADYRPSPAMPFVHDRK